MRHLSIIPDKDLTCKIDFNGKQQHQTYEPTIERTHDSVFMCAHRTTEGVEEKKSMSASATKVISIIVQRVFVICNFTVIRLQNKNNTAKKAEETKR